MLVKLDGTYLWTVLTKICLTKLPEMIMPGLSVTCFSGPGKLKFLIFEPPIHFCLSPPIHANLRVRLVSVWKQNKLL
jgi:hypothetical protein